MIRNALLAGIIAPALLATAVGCESPMHEENVALHRQNRELQDKLDAANAQVRLSPDPAQLKQLQDELAAKDRELTDLRNQPPPPPTTALSPAVPPPSAATAAQAPSPFGDLETTVDARAGTVTVTLDANVLFAPGKATVQPAAQASLRRVAKVLLSKYPGKQVRVEGHTDADPITKTAKDWADNLDLSLGRAASVSRILEADGVPSRLVTTSGFGANRPRGSSKPRNRRVDVVVVTR